LNNLLQEIVIADHIRTLQTIYRDNQDELNLGGEYREQQTKLTTKHLMDKIIEGRSRTIALCRLSYGDDSIETIKAEIDLSSAYALQGMWIQVHDHLSKVFTKLKNFDTKKKDIYEYKLKKGKRAAALVEATFNSLRMHVINNNGQVTLNLIDEISNSIQPILDNYDNNGNDDDDDSQNEKAQLLSHLSNYLNNFVKGQDNQENSKHKKPKCPFWGDLVTFLRSKFYPMSNWIEDMECLILPQNKALLTVPFKHLDQQLKGVAHPAQLSQKYTFFPAITRILSGSDIAKRLLQLKLDVPLYVDPISGNIIDNTLSERVRALQIPQTQSVTYELPLAWEELISKYVFDLENDPFDIIRVQAFTLHGVCQIFTNKLEEAESSFKKALQMVESIGLEAEALACDLYNSIAQMMIMKHKQEHQNLKVKAKQDSIMWLNSEEGRRTLREEINLIKNYYKQKAIILSPAEVEMRAKNVVIREKVKKKMEIYENNSNQSVEAACRYLVKSFEILEEKHGQIHPSIGAACLAVASVQNIINNYEDAREWLIRALKKMEKLLPLPERAIAFIQIQLCQVLSKQGDNDEAILVLSKATTFHSDRARGKLRVKIADETLAEGNKDAGKDKNIYDVLDQSIFDDVKLAIELNSRLVQMLVETGAEWQAADQAEAIVSLTEAAFGWDSAEFAKCKKDAGIQCATAGDWNRAVSHFKGSIESYEAIYGKKDKRTKEVLRLLSSTISKEKKAYNNDDINKDMIETKPTDEANGEWSHAYKIAGDIGNTSLDGDDNFNASLDGDDNFNLDTSSPLTASPKSPTDKKEMY